MTEGTVEEIRAERGVPVQEVVHGVPAILPSVLAHPRHQRGPEPVDPVKRELLTDLQGLPTVGEPHGRDAALRVEPHELGGLTLLEDADLQVEA